MIHGLVELTNHCGGQCEFQGPDASNQVTDLSNLTFDVCVEHSPPLQVIPEDGKRPTGFFPDLFYEIRALLNFSLVLRRPPDGSWGSLRNGSWTGMVGMVVRGECDMAMSEFTMTKERIRDVDFSRAIMRDSVHLAMKKPEASTSWLVFFSVYDPWFWLCLFLSFLFLCCILNLTRIGSNVSSRLLMSLILVLGQSQMGANFNRKSGRILIFTASVFGIIVIVGFQAELTSQMAVHKYTLPAESLEDVSVDDSLTLLVLERSSYESFFSSALPGTTRQKLWSERLSRIPQNLVKSNEEGFERASRDDKTLYVVKKTTFRKSGYPCLLVQSRRVLYSLRKGFIFAKGSPYKAVFDRTLMRLDENGVMDRLLESYALDREADCEETTHHFIGYSDIVMAFALVAAGAVLAVGMVGLEFVKHQIENQTYKLNGKQEQNS